ncbi:IPPc [Musa troglodytarum]|uniref:IPPc n=1 Tax=Musa troglodytarum TaxID=320322 RepID=A0A9E7EQU2_9LILI|nr:IPPc [Musa troglodytarum]
MDCSIGGGLLYLEQSSGEQLPEIVPLNAGNVLVLEDNEPAAKWLSLIDEALNGSTDSETDTDSQTPSPFTTSISSQASGMKTPVSRDSKMHSGPLFFQKPLLKSISKTYRTEQGRRLRACNCPSKVTRKYYRESCFRCQHAHISDDDSTDEEEDDEPSISSVAGLPTTPSSNQQSRIIWLGDLNYRIALSYTETKKLLEENDWDALFEKDQTYLVSKSIRFRGLEEYVLNSRPSGPPFLHADEAQTVRQAGKETLL